MKKKTLEEEVREFFGIQPGPLKAIKTTWQHGDGRNAAPFLRRLIRAAAMYDVIQGDRERQAGSGKE